VFCLREYVHDVRTLIESGDPDFTEILRKIRQIVDGEDTDDAIAA
jgi:hypothetical protein